MTREQILDVFSVKNIDGDTPLHSAQSFTDTAVNYLIELDLGALWAEPNSKNKSPLSLMLTKATPQTVNVILPTVPVIPPGLVSDIFCCPGNSVDVLMRSIELIAEKGGNLNEIINGNPAVTLLTPMTPAVLRELANRGVDLTVTNSEGNNMLFSLANCDVLDTLVKEFGLNVNHTNKRGVTPLLHALELQSPKEIIEKLLELGANPNTGHMTVSPLMLAFKNLTKQRLEILTTLLKAGADPNLKFYNEQKTQVLMPVVSILNVANDTSCSLLELFIEHGADLQMRDDAGNTLLHLLETEEHISYLLKYIDVHETNIFGQTPLWNEKLSPSSCVAMLNIDPNLVNHVANDGSTILFSNNEQIIACVLQHSNIIDLSVLNKRGQSFMHSRLHGPQIFRDLSKVYARQSEESKSQIRRSFNHVDVYGRTVLHYVCEHKELTYVKNMIETFELDLNPNTRTMNLQISWSPATIEYLLSKGSNPNAQSIVTGDTLLHFVCGDPSKADVIRTLLKYGASIDVKNASGISPVDLDPNLKTGYGFATWCSSLTKASSLPRENSWRRESRWEAEREYRRYRDRSREREYDRDRDGDNNPDID